MGTRISNWAPFVSLFLVLMLVVAAGDTSHGLSVQVAYQDKENCGDGRTVVARVMENGDVRIFASPHNEDLGGDQFASRLSEIFSGRFERILFLEADPNLAFQRVAEVIDMSKKRVDSVAILARRVEPGPCLSAHFPPGFFDYNDANHLELPVKMKPVPLWPWQ